MPNSSGKNNRSITYFHEVVAFLYSPCNGEVAEMENDLPDFTPPEFDPKYPMGVMALYLVKIQM